MDVKIGVNEMIQTPAEWIKNGDLGNAAIVIWSVMTKNVNEAGGYVKPADGVMVNK